MRAQPRADRNFRYWISRVYVWAESYLIAAAFTTLTFLGAPAGLGAHAAADPHGGIRRPD